MLMIPKHSSARSIALFATLVAGASLGLAQGSVGVGDSPSYSFRSEVLNGQGIKSLEDLRGKPVLVDFWGTNCPPCVGFAVPSAVKLSQQYGEDLAILFVEVQGATPDKMASFALRQKWLGNSAMWTTERPFSLGLQGIPHSALIDANGKVVMAGYTSEIHSKMEKKIAELVKEAKEAPEGTPKALEKAWKELAKGRYAAALKEARAVAENPRSADSEAAQQSIAEFNRRAESEIARAAWQVENGCVASAMERIERIAKAVEGEAELAERVKELRSKAESNRQELDAARELQKIESKLYAEGPDAKHEKALQKLAEKYAGTRAAARASKLADQMKSA